MLKVDLCNIDPMPFVQWNVMNSIICPVKKSYLAEHQLNCKPVWNVINFNFIAFSGPRKVFKKIQWHLQIDENDWWKCTLFSKGG